MIFQKEYPQAIVQPDLQRNVMSSRSQSKAKVFMRSMKAGEVLVGEAELKSKLLLVSVSREATAMHYK